MSKVLVLLLFIFASPLSALEITLTGTVEELHHSITNSFDPISIGDPITVSYHFSNVRNHTYESAYQASGLWDHVYQMDLDSVEGHIAGANGWIDYHLYDGRYTEPRWRYCKINTRNDFVFNDEVDLIDQIELDRQFFKLLSVDIYDGDGVLVKSTEKGMEWWDVHLSSDFMNEGRLIDIPTGTFSDVYNSASYILLSYFVSWDSIKIVHDELSPGDANADHSFDQIDVIAVTGIGKYQNGDKVSWAQGDWNADGLFNQEDIVESLQTGNYLRGSYAATTPEPNSLLSLILGMILIRRSRNGIFS